MFIYSWRKEYLDIPKGGVYNKEITNQAVFLENRWRLPADWILTAGVRYDHYNVFGGQNTARLTVNRKINKDTNVFVSWGQFFRAPAIEELYSFGVPRGNPHLSPERGETITIGMNSNLSGKTKLQASVFSSRIDDAIVMYPDGLVPTFKNVSKQKRQGLDLSLSHQLSAVWNISTGYSRVQIQNKNEGEKDYHNDPENSQPEGYRLNLGYSRNKWECQLMLRGAAGRDLAAFTATSYWVVDLAANYKINPDFQIYFKAYNLNNSSYELKGTEGYAGLFPMAGRQFYFGLEHRF